MDELHAWMVRVEESVRVVREASVETKTHVSNLMKALEDHEIRLRHIENFNLKLTGAVGFVAAAAGVGATLLLAG